MNYFKPREARFQTQFCFFAVSATKFENVTLVARQRKRFRVFLDIFLIAQLPQKSGVLAHKNSLASCQRCRDSVELRALTCPVKQSTVSACHC